jgi:quinohemoprotein ethanol dehydrogenase
MNRWAMIGRVAGTLVRTLAGAVAVVALASCSGEEPAEVGAEQTPAAGTMAADVGQIDDARVNAADSEPGSWLAHGRDYREQRFSPLKQIDRSSVGRLGLAFAVDLGSNDALEATPIMVDGTLFFTSAFSIVHAVDAATGAERWRYDPGVPRDFLRRTCCGPINRGVAVYQGNVYVATLDGRLVAIDASSGERVWEVNTIIDPERNYSITGAPRAAKGKIFIGNGGAEFGVRGYVTAYDATTGEEVWRFFTVPGDPSLPFEHPEMEVAAKTWKGGNWWEIGGGGTVWNAIVYDPEFDQVYLGVGNGAPWTRAIRSPGGGDNLFLASIVAVDADTGRMRWHYQTVPGDNWDYTAVQDMTLADMTIDGEPRKVLMQAPKNGFFYVIDRSNGKLLRAHPYVTTTWATHVDMETGRPVENPDKDYSERAQWVLPGPLGGHDWQAMSFDESKGIVYMPAQDFPWRYSVDEEFKATGIYKRNPGTLNLGQDLKNSSILAAKYEDEQPDSKGYLKAFDPISGKTLWTVEHVHYWNSGVLATAGGVVFQGDGLGYLSAYNADNGEKLWTFNTYISMLAPPITYEVGGEQYVAILAGTGAVENFVGETNETAAQKYGNFGKLLAFKLGGSEALEEPRVLDRSIPEQPPLTASADDLLRGEQVYNLVCAPCHGGNVRSGGILPDLRLMTREKHQIFKEIVLDGVLAGNGMASFADVLTADDAERIRQYIISRALIDKADAEAEMAGSATTGL